MDARSPGVEQFGEAFDAAFASLQADPEAWAAELAERALLDGTPMDGLHDDPYDDPRIPEKTPPQERA